MLPETKAILYNLFKEYLSTDEQKEFIKNKEKLEILKIEKEKTKKYNPSELLKNRDNKENKYQVDQTTDIVTYKENIFKRIINKIKSIFRRY